jgi:hypothetical protein
MGTWEFIVLSTSLCLLCICLKFSKRLKIIRGIESNVGELWGKESFKERNK